jgi:hypothetical protein
VLGWGGGRLNLVHCLYIGFRNSKLDLSAPHQSIRAGIAVWFGTGEMYKGNCWSEPGQ